MQNFKTIPVKTIVGNLSSPVGIDRLPWTNPVNGAVQQKFYTWRVTLSITQQNQSSFNTRNPGIFNGQDVVVGDWVANVQVGTAWRISVIESKTTTQVIAIVEDVFRYNTYRDSSKSGNGAPPAGSYVVFEMSDTGSPLIDPVPATGTSASFAINLNSRFQYINLQYNFPLYQAGSTFVENNVIAVDNINHQFVLADATYKTVVGRVTEASDMGWFTISPVQKVVDDLDYLPGDIGDTIYSDLNNPGGITIAPGGSEIYIKFRNNTQSISTTGDVSAVITNPTNKLEINKVQITIGGTGSAADLVTSINSVNSTTGVTATFDGSIITFTAVDARAINFYDKSGFTTTDFGLTSVENGKKAAGLYIEKGLRTASSTVVSNLAALQTLSPLIGDQAFVLDSTDNGNNVNEWSMWMWDGVKWIQTSNQDSASTDARTYQLDFDYTMSGILNIGKLSNGRKVVQVIVDVSTVFDGNPTITIGDVNNPSSLMNNEYIDLKTTDSYGVSNDFIFNTGTDVQLVANFTPNGATQGTGKIIITYV